LIGVRGHARCTTAGVAPACARLVAFFAVSACGVAVSGASCSKRHERAQSTGKLQPAAAVARSPTHSPEDCSTALRARRAGRPPGHARIGSWNLHWFPDGQEAPKPNEGGKDIAWLACAVAALDVDVLIVEEVKLHTRARDALHELMRRLDDHTHGHWRLQTMKCGAPETVHVGFLFDSTKVQGADFADVAELNPKPDCTNAVGNGFAGYFAFPGGLDLSIVAAHFLAGDNRDALDGRLVSYAALPRVVRALQRQHGDSDVLVGGDFNTSGCASCKPEITSADEIEVLRRQLDEPGAALSILPHTLPCTQGGSGGWQLLDHFAVNLGRGELPANARVAVHGACEELRCDDRPDKDVVERLTDHCPVVLSLLDRDED